MSLAQRILEGLNSTHLVLPPIEGDWHDHVQLFRGYNNPMANYTIPENVRNIIKECTIVDTAVILPNRQLPREEYDQVNKALVNLGGKWKKGKGHVFESDPAPKIAALLESGVAVDEKKLFQAFYTPEALAKELVEMACIEEGNIVLEPSAGDGRIVKAILEDGKAEVITAVELNPEAYAKLKTLNAVGKSKLNVFTYNEDFLKIGLKRDDFDRIVMNPPFAKSQDLAHIERAFTLLKSGGILVAVMAPKDARMTRLRTLQNQSTSFAITDVEEGTFKESGTNVRTQILKLVKA